MTWSACSLPKVTTTTTSRPNPNALERGRDVPGVLDDPDDVVAGQR
jgi:hypothetical protein